MQKALPVQGVVLTLAALAAGLSSCNQAADQELVNKAEENETAQSDRSSLTSVQPPLDRSAVLLAVAKAASAAALGKPDRETQAALDGKPIEVRIRFGCPSLKGGFHSSPFEVRFAPEKRTLRLRATPDLTIKDMPAVAEDENAIDRVEGFWIRRPWLLDSGCPGSEADATDPVGNRLGTSEDAAALPETGNKKKAIPARNSPAPVEGPTGAPPSRVGIAQYFTKQDSRLLQRGGRPYEATKVLAEGEMPSSIGYDLVLAGRLKALPAGTVIDCRATDIDLAPTCIVFTQLDSVRMERSDTKSLIAEWSRQ